MQCEAGLISSVKKFCYQMKLYLTNIIILLHFQLASETRLDPRPEYQRCTLTWIANDTIPTALTTGNQISSRLLSMRAANALLMLPPRSEQCTSLPQGHVVKAMVIAPL